MPVCGTTAACGLCRGEGTPVVKLAMAFEKDYSDQDVQCAFKAAGQPLQFTKFKLPPQQYRHIDPMFKFAAGYGVCTTDPLSEPRPGQLRVTLVRSKSELPHDHRAWVPVEIIPKWSTVQLADHAAGKGPVAVCTSALHTDGYAGNMVEWAEFHKLVGVSRVFAYDFNSGPLLRPILEFYQRSGLFIVHEWIIPTEFMTNPQQKCLLPFFHPSTSRQEFHAANCSMHQDNYYVGW